MPQKNKQPKGFSAEEQAAMRERYEELQADKAEAIKLVLKKITALPEPDRSMAKKLHKLVLANAPKLTPRTWYGMPAYANADGKVICFFTPASKFKSRYATFGFNDQAKLDKGTMWPVSFALKKLSKQDESKLAALVKKAIK